ncbi:MAG TPA: GNAT family N-acetyltransferase [Rubricoccaceae bacterium]|nr:GNAT family N-acetyltransferase [Rubricoccaceae bacterium]
MPLTIRPLRPDEHGAWLVFRRALWPDVDEATHAFEIAEHSTRGDANAAVLVAEADGGALAGFVELSVRERVDGSMEERVGYLEGWYVAPEWRGHGVGRALVEAGEAWTRARGLRELASDAEIENEGSIAAHRALGFRETFRVVQFLKRLEEWGGG